MASLSSYVPDYFNQNTDLGGVCLSNEKKKKSQVTGLLLTQASHFSSTDQFTSLLLWAKVSHSLISSRSVEIKDQK